MELTLQQVKLDKLSLKYKNVEAVIRMVDSGETDLLNPAYNEEFSKFVDKIAERLNEPAYFTSSKDGEETTHTWELAGTGGIGSNILRMYGNFYHEETNTGTKFAQPFFEGDSWEYSNLPRIPINPNSIEKRDSFKKYGSTSTNETDISEPVIMMATQLSIGNISFFGAMDIFTRSLYHNSKIPFIAITHNDDSVKIELNPTPPTDLEISTESYGLVDINFMIPATQMTAIYMYLLQTKHNEDFEKIENKIAKYKELKAKQLKRDLMTNDRKAAVVHMVWSSRSKVTEFTKETEQTRDPLLIAKKAHSEMYACLHTPEGRVEIQEMVRKYSIEDKDMCDFIDIDTKEIHEIIKRWDEMDNIPLLKIKQDDVKRYLKCKDGDEAINLVTELMERPF